MHHTMKRFFTFLFVFLTLLVFRTETTSGQNPGQLDLKDLQTSIDKAFQEWDIPGMAIAIVKDGEVVFSKGYGVRNALTGGTVNTHTLFGIASNTKAMTAAALAILVDEGIISWDDKVEDYIPWFKLYDQYVSEEVTIRDLLCHRVGLATYSGDLVWYGSSYNREEVIRRARFLKPVYPFRSGYGYSNIMFLTAGKIVTAVTGQIWDDFISERIFDPLDMKNTYTSIIDITRISNTVKGHVKVEDRQIPVEWVNWDNIAPAGSVNSSVHDMAKWLILQLSRGSYEGQEIFSEKTSLEMWSVQNPFKVDDASTEIWPSKHFNGYGLGWSLFDYHGHKVVTHGGGLDGQISRVALVPEENLGMVILTNSINSFPSYLMYEVLDRYFGQRSRDWSQYGLEKQEASAKRREQKRQKFLESRVPDTKPSLPLEAYTGRYGGDLYGDAEVRIENGKLVLDFLPTPIYAGDLEHWHYNTFTIKLRNVPSLPTGTVQFILDTSGKPVELKVDIPNPDFDFTELEFLKKE